MVERRRPHAQSTSLVHDRKIKDTRLEAPT